MTSIEKTYENLKVLVPSNQLLTELQRAVLDLNERVLKLEAKYDR